ncbi:MAG: FAD-dependent oxidoreductase, partial [Candidatus Thorarchaeota archaeon]
MTVAGEKTVFEQLNPAETALVIGGGVSGMQAALDLADQGFRVVLVEKTPSVGGAMAMLDKTFPTMDCSACILTPRLSEVSRHPNIELLTYSEVKEVTGRAGDFKVRVLRKTRKVLEAECSGCGDCLPHCFPQNTPLVYTIDSENCIKCGMCVKFCEREAIDLDMTDEEIVIPVGAIVLATGYELFDVAEYPRFGYSKYKNVINALEYERLINASGPTAGHLMRL